MLVTVCYKDNGVISAVYKEQAPHKYRQLLKTADNVGVVLKGYGSLGSLQSHEIKKQFRVADVPKEGFVVLERVKDA